MGTSYQYPENQDGDDILQSLVGSLTSNLKQESPGHSGMTMLDPASSTADCTQSYTLLNYPATNNGNQDAQRQANRSTGANVIEQRNPQIPLYHMSGMTDPINWYFPFGGE